MRGDKSATYRECLALCASGALGGISGRCVGTRISLLKQPLGLHDPGSRFVFAAEARDRPGWPPVVVISTLKEPSLCGDTWNVAVAIPVSMTRRYLKAIYLFWSRDELLGWNI